MSDVDAIAMTAERGAAWSLLYPRYSVVVPQPNVIRLPLAYPVARGDQDLADFLTTWIELKKSDGTIDRLYDYWILGQDAEPRTPRWSIIRDVLHWVE
jgi:ABC-type amino acid transport substrate-binding protein